MWTTLKTFFSRGKTPKPSANVDLTAVTMLQQLVKSHLKGRIMYPEGGLEQQSKRIVNSANLLGIPGDNVIIVDKNIKKVLADNALGRTNP